MTFTLNGLGYLYIGPMTEFQKSVIQFMCNSCGKGSRLISSPHQDLLISVPFMVGTHPLSSRPYKSCSHTTRFTRLLLKMVGVNIDNCCAGFAKCLWTQEESPSPSICQLKRLTVLNAAGSLAYVLGP